MSPPKSKGRRSQSSSSSSSSSSNASSSDSRGKKRESDNEGASSDSSAKHNSKLGKEHTKRFSEDSTKYERKKKTARNSDKNDQKTYIKDHEDASHKDQHKKRHRRKDDRHHRNFDDRHQRNEDDSRHRRSDDRGNDGRRHADYRGERRGGRERSQYDDKDRRDDRNGRRNRSRSRSFDHSNAKWGRNDSGKSKDDAKSTGDKQKPNFGLSGKLTEETNSYRGVVIKYSEPPEARKPKRRWRLYPFKGEKALQTLYIHRESAYLIGRERKVVDLAVDHPSCSKQHAALQYRLVPFTRDDGSAGKRVRPYLIDLESANGTFINNKKIEPRKYVELLERDVIKFGFSSREYVLLHENSKDETQDDDVKVDEEIVEVKKEEQDI